MGSGRLQGSAARVRVRPANPRPPARLPTHPPTRSRADFPVVRACLEVFNCTPTDPPDGKEYLSVVFEACGTPGGTQARLLPWAVAGLILYVAAYPLCIAAVLWRYAALMDEDQLLRAAGTGDSEASNPHACECGERVAMGRECACHVVAHTTPYPHATRPQSGSGAARRRCTPRTALAGSGTRSSRSPAAPASQLPRCC